MPPKKRGASTFVFSFVTLSQIPLRLFSSDDHLVFTDNLSLELSLDNIDLATVSGTAARNLRRLGQIQPLGTVHLPQFSRSPTSNRPRASGTLLEFKFYRLSRILYARALALGLMAFSWTSEALIKS